MSGEDVNLHCAVILTAIPVEYQAVRAHLDNIRLERHEKGNIYERGTFLAGDHSWEVGIVEVGTGNAFTAVQTERAISYFKPVLVLFVGVAGSLKDVDLGDVVVATKVYDYESGKSNVTFQPRPEVGNVPYRMVELARSEARTNNWLKRLNKQIPDPPPRVLVAPIAAGGSVVSSTNSSIGQRLKKNYGDAVAVEMEGHGFLKAVYANPEVDALVIRGISDRIDDKSEADAKNFQAIASQHASAFAFEILAKLDTSQHLQHMPVVNPTIPSIVQQEELKKTLPEKSVKLLSEEDTSNEFNDFCNTLLNYYSIIKKFFSFFDSGQDIYEDQCDDTIEALNNVSRYLNTLNANILALDRAITYDLDNLQPIIHGLKADLNKFRTFCPPGTTPLKRRLYTIELERIRYEKNNFLEKLEAFQTRLNQRRQL